MPLTTSLLRHSLVLLLVLAWPSLARAERTNVLFIIVDDLRPALGCYDDPIAKTPNIDRLAARGTTFLRAYCQQAVCSPSRLSLITGRRPDSTRVWDLSTHFREALPDVVTLPQHFKKNGYHSRSIGKILHGGGKASQDPPSWSKKPLFDIARDVKLRYATAANLRGSGHKRAASESADVADDRYVDGMVCNAALEALDNASRADSPFFLAVGFRKPHLPFSAPKKYWDLYDRAKIPLPAYGKHPDGAPELATRSWRELEGYTDIPKNGRLTEAKVRELRHGYYACVSYTDALVGRLLARLDKLDLTKQTVVVLVGDHGFHLGEQGLWTKANNFDLSTRVPLIVAAPGAPQASGGTKCSALVELVDLYPTLAELCDLPKPEDLEGTSFRASLTDATREGKTHVYSQHPRSFRGNRYRGRGDIMGYTVRTKRHRYVEWIEHGSERVVARELYDHETDPNEQKNVADATDHAMVVEKLSRRLATYRGASGHTGRSK